MLSKFLIVGVTFAVSLACARGDARAEAPGPGADAKKPAPAAVTASSPLAPLAAGKRVRITKLYEIKPVEALVPDGVKLKMSHLDDDDILPRANLIGGVLNLEVLAPEEGFFSLADDLKMRGAKQTFLRAYEDGAGYVLVWKSEKTGTGTVFGTFVSRPQLKVVCRQSDMKSAEDAELAASVCLTLRSPGK